MLPKEDASKMQLRKQWDYIYKRGKTLRETLGAMTPSVAGTVDRTRQFRLDSVRNMFKRN